MVRCRFDEPVSDLSPGRRGSGLAGDGRTLLQPEAPHRVRGRDEERRAAMVSNLLVVLCGDKAAQPVVNTGTLYA